MQKQEVHCKENKVIEQATIGDWHSLFRGAVDHGAVNRMLQMACHGETSCTLALVNAGNLASKFDSRAYGHFNGAAQMTLCLMFDPYT